MQNELKKIDDRTAIVEVYHIICMAAEEYYRLSINIPKALLEVQQHIHGRFENALYHVYKASNEKELEMKLEDLDVARMELFFQYSSIEYLVKTHAITVGAANVLLTKLKEAYIQVSKWRAAILKDKA